MNSDFNDDVNSDGQQVSFDGGVTFTDVKPMRDALETLYNAPVPTEQEHTAITPEEVRTYLRASSQFDVPKVGETLHIGMLEYKVRKLTSKGDLVLRRVGLVKG